MVKLTKDMVAAFGAKDPNDFGAKLTELLKSVSDTGDRLNSLELANAEQKLEISALQDRPALSEAKNEWVTQAIEAISFDKTESCQGFAAQVRTIAASEGSKAACEVLAKTGTDPVAPSAPAPEQTPAQKAEATGDLDALYASDPKLQANFPNVGAFKAFRQLEGEGRVKITSKR